jgi:hypothetical protein
MEANSQEEKEWNVEEAEKKIKCGWRLLFFNWYYLNNLK